MLYRNNVAPEQVLFDAGCADYQVNAPTSLLLKLLRTFCGRAMNLLTTKTLESVLSSPPYFLCNLFIGSVQGRLTGTSCLEVCFYIHTYTHAHTNTCKHVRTHSCLHTHIHT